MKKLIYFLSLIVITISFNGCSKSNSTPPTTSLQITASDALGNKVAGATVTLYSSQADLTNATNPVGTGFTDANGVVKFDGLTTIKYYWMAVAQCENNVNGSYFTATPLTANIANTVSTVLTGTGTLKYVNNSANPYTVFINGTQLGIAAGSTTSQSINMPVGSYSIRVLQNSGYLVTPTDETFTGTLSCGGTLTTTFP